MKLIVTANKVPFMPGGADYHSKGLVTALKAHGHDVELLQFPFRFSPASEVSRVMNFCEGTDLNQPNGVRVDKVISLQFPGYGVQHDDHRVWIMHQHRAVYELYEQQLQSTQLATLRDEVCAYDARTLAGAAAVFANSKRVAERLKLHNDLEVAPLYHPPYGANAFYCEEAYDYFFCPSRLEKLKRQDLVIEAAALTKNPVRVLVGGEGGQKQRYQQLIGQFGVEDRVTLIGRFSETEKRVLYARALGVLFVPHDEDYGYITLEAMLSAKPVITCSDSGGPLEFVEHEHTGFVVPPEAAELALRMDQLYEQRALARNMGQRGRASLDDSDISWANVVQQLLQ